MRSYGVADATDFKGFIERVLEKGSFQVCYSLTLGRENDKIFASECRVMQTLK